MLTDTYYSLWQQTHYGSALPSSSPELENGTQAAEEAVEWAEAMAERELMEAEN